MKAIASVLAVLFLFPAVSFASQNDAENVSRIYRVSGDVFVTQGKNPTQRVTNSEPVVSDTLIQTGDNSAALLRFEDGQVVTMQADSIFKVREYRYDAKRIGNSSIVFSMFQGGMRFISGLIGQHNRQAFRLSTPDATIGIHGTDFMVSMVGKSVYSRVLAGKITMTNAAGMKTVATGQTVVATSSAVLASPVSTLAVPAEAFGKLQFIPIDPAAIPTPTPAPEPAPTPAVPAAPAAAAPPETPVTATTVVPAAVVMPATSASAAGTAMAGMAAGEPEPATPETAPPVETAPAAGAEESPDAADQQDSYRRSDLSVTGKISTLGLGAELDIALTGSLGARIGLNSYSYQYNANSSTVNYDFHLKLQTVSALADWYPFEDSSFRTSLGVMYNNNKVSLNGQPTGGTYTINGNTYSSTDVGSLQGEMSFNKVAPYIGIGWGKPSPTDQGWGMTTDFGVLFQGTPKTSLVATCGSAIAGTASCTQLQSDTAAENTKLQNDLGNFKFWPVASIGISYQW